MSDLLGIIVPLKKFMSNLDEDVFVSLETERKIALSLKKDRIYDIPDFQREIRWSVDDVAMLIDDIKTGPKFLGNIILTKHIENKFSIIDGQQRITVLTMILNCIKFHHKDEIEIINPCNLTIESFKKFTTIMEQGFDERLYTEEVYESDKLKQISKYTRLWKYIKENDDISNRYEAKKIIDNLGACSFNIILNEEEGISEGIRYFIDVNLKGKQLDIEDIFKSYLFRNDSSLSIRKQWYLLKTSIVKIENSKMEYPLLKLLEHYFLCDLYSDGCYQGMEFGTDFLLKKQYKEDGVLYRKGTHLIEMINSNQYMKKSLEQLNRVAQIMLIIVNSASITSEIKEIFKNENQNESIDDVEMKVIHNITSKILKDTKILPKALLIKYFLVILFGENGKSKEMIRTIYGIYLFSVLFSVFENKKSSEILINIIKANEKDWYMELVKQINNYFGLDKITDSRLMAQYKYGQNEEEEDQRFRCKSLATIYNFFVNQNGKVHIRKGKMADLYEFITDDKTFTIEHFIISESKTQKVIVQGNEYIIGKTIYKRYVNNFFNFIFIYNNLNSKLGNNWLPRKLELIEESNVTCEYSKMIINSVSKLGEEFSKRAGEDYKDKLDLFFVREFKDIYIDYTKVVLNDIISRINNYKKGVDGLKE